MYTNNKSGSTYENAITVTPIKVEVNMSPSYPTPNSSGGSVAVAATTSARRSAANSTTNSFTVSTSSTTGATPKEKPTKAARSSNSITTVRKPPPTIDTFWPSILSEVRSIQQVDAKHQALPLARIKKIMKLDENAKMIAAEAPLLFAKACEYFIQELTMRAWIHTEESKRRTLQRSDIAQAIANYDQFDFLIDIVPREDIKPSTCSHKKDTHHNAATTSASNASSTSATATTATSSSMAVKVEQQPEIISFGALTQDALATMATAQQQQQPQQQAAPQHLQIIQQTAAQPQQLQYFITIPGQQAGQPQLVQQLQLPQQLPNGLTPQLTGLNLVAAPQQAPQQLILTAGPNGQLTATPAPTNAATSQQQQHHTALVQNLAHHQQQQQQQQHIQLLQQVVTPNGELTNVPITINANQLNLLRLQMQQQPQHQQQQQVIIPTQCLTTQQLLQLTGGNAAASTNAASVQQQLQQQVVQQQQHNSGNIFLTLPSQQQQQQVTGTQTSGNDRNIGGNTYRSNC